MEKKKRKRREEEEEEEELNNTTDDTIIITTTTTNNTRCCLEWRSSRLEKEESSSQRECEKNRETVERYSRQMRLPFFQHDERSKGGQSRLFKAHVFIAGAGGLGCPSVLYLAGAGVGKITVCDADAVEKSNLHRQICHRNEDCCSENKTKTNKAVSAIRAAKSLNPTCSYRAVEESVNEQNAMELLRDADVVLDCTDNQRARYVLSDACAKLRTPLVSGASLGVEGQLVVYNERGMSDGGNDEDDVERGPCLRCAYPSPPPADECGSCAEQGVLNVAPGIVGTFQALECIRILLSGQCRYGKDEENEKGKIMSSSSAFPYRPLGLMTLFDFVQNPSRPTTCVKIKRRKDCLVCATSATRDAFTIESYNYDAFVNGGSVQRCSNGIDNKAEDGMQSRNRITCEELAQILVENDNNNAGSLEDKHHEEKEKKEKSVILFDVRNEIEFSIAALKGAINYPFVDEDEGEEKKAAETRTTTNIVVDAVDKTRIGTREKEKAAEVDVIAFICRRGNDSQLARERFKQKILNRDVAKNERRMLTIAEDGSNRTQTKKKTFYFDAEKCQIVDVIGGLKQWKRSIDATFPNLD